VERPTLYPPPHHHRPAERDGLVAGATLLAVAAGSRLLGHRPTGDQTAGDKHHSPGGHPAPHPPQGATHVAGQLALRRAAGPLGQRRVCQQRVKSDIRRWALIS
jgi:hypothetical protein